MVEAVNFNSLSFQQSYNVIVRDCENVLKFNYLIIDKFGAVRGSASKIDCTLRSSTPIV